MRFAQRAVAYGVTTTFLGFATVMLLWRHVNKAIDRAVDEAWELMPEDFKIV